MVQVGLGKQSATPQQVRALRDSLDRLGVGHGQRVELSGGLDHISDEELEAVALQLAAEQGWRPGEE